MNELLEFFAGLGFFAISTVIAYVLYQLARIIKAETDRDVKRELVEIVATEKYAIKKGINLLLEEEKRKIHLGKTFRDRLREEVNKDFFGEEEFKRQKN